MKKMIAMFLAICMLLCLTACQSGSADNEESTGGTAESTGSVQTGGEGSDQTPPPDEDPVTGGFVFTYNGTEISLHANAAPILDALGEPKSYTEQASCAFEGLDKTYYFGSFYMDTYPVGDADFVYSIWFADDSVTTAEGIYIGASQAEVEAAYGADAYNGTNAYIVTEGDTELTVILEEGVVTSIQYAVVIG